MTRVRDQIPSLKFSLITDAKLKTATAAVLGIMLDWNTVVQFKRPEVRDVEPDARSIIIVIVSKIPLICVRVDHTDVIEYREAQEINNGDAIFRRTEPVGVSTQRLAGVVLGANLPVAEAA